MKISAAVNFCRANTGKRVAGTCRRQLATRFGWSRRTASVVINALLKRGLLESVVTRRANGMFRAVTYKTPPLARTALARSTVKYPGNGTRANGQPGNASAGDLHTFGEHQDTPPTVDKPSHTLRARPARTARVCAHR